MFQATQGAITPYQTGFDWTTMLTGFLMPMMMMVLMMSILRPMMAGLTGEK
jgi:hypothetical protein